MRRRKRTKTIDDVSVTKLLDEFVDLDVEDDAKRKDMDDEEYIQMMVEKENKRNLERAKRALPARTQDKVETSSATSGERPPKKLAKPMEEVFPATCESDLSPEDEAAIDEIMKTQDLMDEVGSSEAKRAARKTLEKHRKGQPSSKKKKDTPVISEKRAPLKRCQNCYFCVGERKISGSCWCHCTNPGRSTHAIAKGSWVKSRMNLPCWKPPQE